MRNGGGKVTLSGGGQHRILYMNTCDQGQGWTPSHCDNQEDPQLTVQNLTFADGNSTGEQAEGGGGGTVFVRGGQFKVVNSRFVGNRCDTTGPDLGKVLKKTSTQAALTEIATDQKFGYLVSLFGPRRGRHPGARPVPGPPGVRRGTPFGGAAGQAAHSSVAKGPQCYPGAIPEAGRHLRGARWPRPRLCVRRRRFDR